MAPTVLLTFANDEDAHLELLKEESSQLDKILFPLHDERAIEVVREESGTTDELIEKFQRYDQRLTIFHYGGHAGGKGLRLEGGDAQANGLAELLQQQADTLKLVFLNGCSTLPQVNRLLELGIKAVIATSAPIQDAMAVEFAEIFYKGLVARQSIRRAFNGASASIRTKYEGVAQPGIIEYRGIKLRKKKGGQFPWGLYIHQEHKDILQWKMPLSPDAVAFSQKQTDFSPNQYLKYVLDAMLYLNDGLRERLCDEDGCLADSNGNPLNDQQKFYNILQNLPWPIGAQFQKLIALRKPDLERLKQITSTYFVTSQTVLYIVISQLWDRTSDLPEKKWEKLLEVIDVTREEFLVFDYLAFAKELRLSEYFGEEHPPFVREVLPFLEELDDSDSELFKSYMFLEAMRDGIQAGEIPEEEAPAYCEDAESALTVLLSRVAFLVSYSLIAVREIEIINYRHAEVEYRHRIGELNGVGDMLGLSSRLLKQYVCCDSVILAREMEDLDDPEKIEEIVNLSPFIIDENAFLKYSTDVINIYMYAFREEDTYYYYKVNGNVFNVLERKTPLLAVRANREEPEDKPLKKFLPVKQGTYLKGSIDVSSTFHGRRAENPYAKLVEQFEAIEKALSTRKSLTIVPSSPELKKLNHA